MLKSSIFFIISGALATGMLVPAGHWQTIFDGKTFNGWQGDTSKTWRIENGALVGGSLKDTVPHNDFLCTKKSYDDFHLKLQFMLLGSEGFINSGVQFRSRRLQQPDYEMSGYQADLGKGYWGSLYDESRRNKTLSILDSAQASTLFRSQQWNDYEIIATGRHIQVFLNDHKTVDYTERDLAIPQSGLIALQVHGGGKCEVRFRNVQIYEK
jgi:hypothetical protein